jgi:hypothetical protein
MTEATETSDEYRDPVAADRDARRAARTQRRGTTADMPVVAAPSRPKPSAVALSPMRALAAVAIVAVGALVAALMTSADVTGWIVGLTVAVVTLALSAVPWPARDARR